MSTTPPPSANSGTISKTGESAEYMFGSSAAQPAGHNGNSRNSAEQPVDGNDSTESVALTRAAQQGGSASTSASRAEQAFSSFTPYH